jgi:hypothetical protein
VMFEIVFGEFRREGVLSEGLRTVSIGAHVHLADLVDRFVDVLNDVLELIFLISFGRNLQTKL